MEPLETSEEILEKLAALQSSDSGLDELERLQKNFQKEIDGLQASLASLRESLQTEKKALEELLKTRKTLELEVGVLDTRIKKYQGQESEVKSNEQFAALKMEIEKSKEEKAKAEEKILEELFQEDSQKLKIQDLAARLAQDEKKADSSKKELEAKIADCGKAALDKKTERQERLALLSPDYAQGYEALRKSGKKIAVAMVLEDDTCSGCHMNVPPQVLHQIKKGVGVERCDCGRYLHMKG